MKQKLITVLCFSALMLFMLNCQKEVENQSHEETIADDSAGLTLEQSIARGEYLVLVQDCDDCHTPKIITDHGPVPDMEKRFMGFPAGREIPEIPNSQDWVFMSPDLMAAAGPWGVTFSANITPHETGIGNWTYEHFKKSFTEGKHKGLDNSRAVLPPMPWQNKKYMDEKDVRAIYDYLKSIEPIDNLVPSARLNAPPSS